MQKRTTRITAVRRAAIAGAASTALIAGMIAPAGAQPAENPVMSEAPGAPRRRPSRTCRNCRAPAPPPRCRRFRSCP